MLLPDLAASRTPKPTAEQVRWKAQQCPRALASPRMPPLCWASGVTLEYSPLRHANNLESVLTYEGTSEMHMLSSAKALTVKPPSGNSSLCNVLDSNDRLHTVLLQQPHRRPMITVRRGAAQRQPARPQVLVAQGSSATSRTWTPPSPQRPGAGGWLHPIHQRGAVCWRPQMLSSAMRDWDSTWRRGGKTKARRRRGAPAAQILRYYGNGDRQAGEIYASPARRADPCDAQARWMIG